MLAHLQNCEYDGDDHEYSAAERNMVRILDNHIYSSKVLRINFTSYDVRREQDSMNPRTNCNVMVLSPESGEDAGTPKSLACFMLGSFTRILLLPTNLSRILSFSGSAGLDSFLISDLDSRKHDCPKLAFSRIQIHLHSAFWTLLWSYGVAILSRLLLMERLLTCSQSCTVLLDHPMSMRTGWPSMS